MIDDKHGAPIAIVIDLGDVVYRFEGTLDTHGPPFSLKVENVDPPSLDWPEVPLDYRAPITAIDLALHARLRFVEGKPWGTVTNKLAERDADTGDGALLETVRNAGRSGLIIKSAADKAAAERLAQRGLIAIHNPAISSVWRLTGRDAADDAARHAPS